MEISLQKWFSRRILSEMLIEDYLKSKIFSNNKIEKVNLQSASLIEFGQFNPFQAYSPFYLIVLCCPTDLLSMLTWVLRKIHDIFQ